MPVPRKPDALGAAFTSGQWWAWVSRVRVCAGAGAVGQPHGQPVGRIYRAVRDDEVAAQLSGIHVARTQVNAFVVSSATAGLAGAVFVLINTNAQPGMFGLTLSLFLVLAIVLGGLGSLAGGYGDRSSWSPFRTSPSSSPRPSAQPCAAAEAGRQPATGHLRHRAHRRHDPGPGRHPESGPPPRRLGLRGPDPSPGRLAPHGPAPRQPAQEKKSQPKKGRCPPP